MADLAHYYHRFLQWYERYLAEDDELTEVLEKNVELARENERLQAVIAELLPLKSRNVKLASDLEQAEIALERLGAK